MRRPRIWKWFTQLEAPWQAAVVLGLLVIVAIAIGLAAKSKSDSKTALVADVDGFYCHPATVKFDRCPINRYYGKTIPEANAAKRVDARAEARALVVAKAKAKAAKAKAKAKAKADAQREAAAAKAEAQREAAAHAAYVRAANVWHQGYFQQDRNIYWKLRDDLGCADYATDGCLRVEVITRAGCPSYVGVDANEYQGGSVVGDLLDNNGNGVPPKTSALFELDLDAGADDVKDLKIQCE